MPCCMDACKTLKVGSVITATIEELWNNSSMERIRTLHLQGQYDEESTLCQVQELVVFGKSAKRRRMKSIILFSNRDAGFRNSSWAQRY